jgi:CO/xanthine dehydrogenase Mo-binding subunit
VSYFGRSVRRLEDRPLLTGRACFAADYSFPGQVHMAVVRSQVASGRLLGIDAGAASQLPGVVAVWTGAEVASIPPIDFRMSVVAGLEPYRQPVLAATYVRYVGEPLAAIFAEDPYLAEDAAGLVYAEIEELPPALDPTRPGTFYPDLPAEATRIEKGYGDLEAAFAEAADTIELRLSIGRHTGVPLETRGGVAVWDEETGILRVYGAAKVPHYNRRALATMLGLEEEHLHLHEGHVGGSFGVRGELYPEDVLIAAAALRLGRPVKWIEDRREHLLATNHSRDQVHLVKAAFGPDGFILGLDDEFWQDQGAYVRTHAVTVSDLTAALLPGPYQIPAYRAVGHMVLTNKTPAGTYRAPGRYEGTFVRERLLDAIAHRLDVDPIEVRRINLIEAASMPFSRRVDALGTEVTYDSGQYREMLDKALEAFDYQAVRRELAERRSRGEMVGAGVAMFVEKSGLGPFDEALVRVREDGKVEVVTGAASVGQGIETVVAQICADIMGVDLDSIRVIHGQTDAIGAGMGAFASRVTVMTGSATAIASEQARQKALAVAGELLGAEVAELSLAGGRVSTTDSTRSLSLGELAAALRPGLPLSERHGSGLEGRAVFTTQHMTYPYGVHVAVVEVDPESFSCRVVKYQVAYDVGRAVNPKLVEGQIVGAVAQGIGGALLEDFVYDEQGQPLAASFADYLLPTVAEVPPVETIVLEEAPSPLNPLGVKGAGEGGVNAAGAAIAAAVDDAVGRPGAVRSLPLTPDRLRNLMS